MPERLVSDEVEGSLLILVISFTRAWEASVSLVLHLVAGGRSAREDSSDVVAFRGSLYFRLSGQMRELFGVEHGLSEEFDDLALGAR